MPELSDKTITKSPIPEVVKQTISTHPEYRGNYGENTRLKKMGLDNLDSAAMLLDLEEEYGIDFGNIIPDEIRDDFLTPRQIADYISQLLSN